MSTAPALRPNCRDCGAAIGAPHVPGCDVERCSACKGQAIQCECAGHDPLASAWTGEWPGVAECRARGWYSVLIPHRGWRTCVPETPGATEDLNRLSVFEQTGQDHPSPDLVPGEWNHEGDRSLWSGLTNYGAHPNAGVRDTARALLDALIAYDRERTVAGLPGVWTADP